MRTTREETEVNFNDIVRIILASAMVINAIALLISFAKEKRN